MEDKFKAFPKIGQFAGVVKHIRQQHDFQGLDEDGKAIIQHLTDYPVLKFIGTVKTHGTCSGVRVCNGVRTPESRTRDISINKDNAGFAAFVAGLPDEVWNLLPQDGVIFGEWCGSGIQKGVAICQLPKMWILFDKFVEREDASSEYVHERIYNLNEDSMKILNEHQVYFVDQFKKFEIEIDFNYPELSSNRLGEMTQSVEDECPVGKAFGVSGIGEGIVYRPADYELSLDSGSWYKVKGEKFAVTKTKTLAPVDVEKMNSVQEFVEATVTQNRLKQGLYALREAGLEVDRKSTGFYLKWIVDDILKEELNLLTTNHLCAKDVGKAISNKARVFWFQQTDAI